MCNVQSISVTIQQFSRGRLPRPDLPICNSVSQARQCQLITPVEQSTPHPSRTIPPPSHAHVTYFPTPTLLTVFYHLHSQILSRPTLQRHHRWDPVEIYQIHTDTMVEDILADNRTDVY